MATKRTMSLMIDHANGDQSDEPLTLKHARQMLRQQYGVDIVIHDEWEPAGDHIERKLVWACREDSLDDAGANAVASIVRSFAD